MKAFVRWLIHLVYGFRAHNEAVLATPGPVLLLPNHSSWLDWLFIGLCLEDDWRFVTSRTMADNAGWIVRRIMINRRTFAIDINSPYAVKHVAEYLQKGGRLVLFPEGRLSRTGSLMKLFDGTGFLLHKTHAKVITAYIHNAYRLPLSPNPNQKKWFPRVTVHFSNELSPPRLERISATDARTKLTGWLLDQLIKQRFEVEMTLGPATVLEAIVQSLRQRPAQIVLQDVTQKQITGRRLLMGAELLARQWRKHCNADIPVGVDRLNGSETGRQECRRYDARIGILLPNVNAFPVTLLSLWVANKIPAILNYSAGTTTMLACARLADLKQIITSREFIRRFKLDIEPFKTAGIELVYLEDVRTQISQSEKLLVSIRQLFNFQPPTLISQPDATAVILFTSGSEAEPKGVELTHGNLLANIRQMLSMIDLLDTDRFFNALPLFHSFGLTIGLLLPLTRGVFVFVYLSPLHYRIVPSAFYNLDCTVMFGTNTFLNGYARRAHPIDFRSLRYLFAGAEKIQESTAETWMRKFGVRVLEGYGATECSPCLTVNTPPRARLGSAGRFLPGIEWRLEAVEGVSEGERRGARGEGQTAFSSSPSTGRLFVRGPNVMRGYLNADANAAFRSLGGWYDTGDIVKVDADGFVHVVGRLKRFAKVSGEMVSLAAVEDALAGAFPQYNLHFTVAVVAQPDGEKGETLIAVTNEPRLKLEEIRDALRSRGLSNLALPRKIKVMQDIPRLGTGKVNHRELEKMIQE